MSIRARNVIRQNDWGCSQNQAGILEQVVYGIFCAYQSGHKVAYLNCDVKRVWENTKAYWLPRFTFDCPTCGEKSIMSCPYCGSSLLAINKAAKIVCKGCCEVLDICNCDEGHVIPVTSAFDTLTLLPTPKTQELIVNLLREEFAISLNCTFQLICNRVELYPLHRKNRLINVDDVLQLGQINQLELTSEEYDGYIQVLRKMKEKCPGSKIEKCHLCSLSNDKCCLMKIFTTFDDFKPAPHNGHELGDVSFYVDYEGEKYLLVGVIKSAPKEPDITRSSKTAREMLQQIFVLAQDAKVKIIGVICPSIFQTQFKADLEFLSILTGKPIVILDSLYMCKQYKSFIKSSMQDG